MVRLAAYRTTCQVKAETSICKNSAEVFIFESVCPSVVTGSFTLYKVIGIENKVSSSD